MARRHPHDAEVVGCRDDPFAHQLEPHAVGYYPGSERVVAGGDPESEVEPPAPCGDFRRLVGRAEHLHEAAWHRFTRLIHFAARQERAVDGLRAVEDPHDERPRAAVLAKLIEVGPGRRQLGAGALHAEERRRPVLLLPFAAGGLRLARRRFGTHGEVLHLPPEPGKIVGRERRDGRGQPGLRRQLDERRRMDVLQLHSGAVERLGAHEDAGQRVVVALRDGVEGVVVAAGAGECEPEHRLRHDVDLLVDDVHLELSPVAFIEPLGAEREKSGGDDLPRLVGRPRMPEQVAGDLGLEKVVVGHIVVEGRDHPVAVAPGMGIGEIRLLAARFGVAGDVEPVSGLALAEARRREQAIDHPLECPGRRVLVEVVDLFGRRRQPREVERHPAEERLPVGVGHRPHAGLLHLREEEAVDVTGRPIGVGNLRNGRRRRFLKRPVAAAGVEIGLPGVGSGRGRLGRGVAGHRHEGHRRQQQHLHPSKPAPVCHPTALAKSHTHRPSKQTVRKRKGCRGAPDPPPGRKSTEEPAGKESLDLSGTGRLPEPG